MAITVSIDVGISQVQGQNPTLRYATGIDVGVISIVGLNPSIPVYMPAGIISVAGQTPSLYIYKSVQMDVGVITLSSPAFTLKRSVLMDKGIIRLIAPDPSALLTLVEYACYVLNTETKRTYQFSNYGFKGFGRFNRTFIGTKGNKIYDLETLASDDAGTDIDAYFEIDTDFAIPNYKGFRSLFVEDDTVKVTITDLKGRTTTHTIESRKFRSLPKSLVDKAFTIKFENVRGSSVTIRRIHGKLNVLEIKGA